MIRTKEGEITFYACQHILFYGAGEYFLLFSFFLWI